MAVRGYADPEVEHVYARARELCQRVGQSPQLWVAILGLSIFYLNRSEPQTAIELAEQLLGIAERAAKASLLLSAHLALGIPRYWQGHPAKAVEHLDRTIALYDPGQHRSLAYVQGHDPGVLSRLISSAALWELGYPDRALQRIEGAVTLAEEGAHPPSVAFALAFCGILHWTRREHDRARQYADRALVISREQGFPLFLGSAMVVRGATAGPRAPDGGIAEFEAGMAHMAGSGNQLAAPEALGALGELYAAAGRQDDALGILETALGFSREKDQHFWDAELYRLKGEVLLRANAAACDEAEGLFHSALTVARTQGAKSLELRAAASLARLWQRQGRTGEARGLLAPIYDWFTEGFETPDLQEAKALLDGLS
jgi:adenylate cyclase